MDKMHKATGCVTERSSD